MNRPESWTVGEHICIRVSEQDARQLLEGLDSWDTSDVGNTSDVKAWLRGELERHLLSVQQGNDR
jgi:hypothetical protein